MTKTNYFDMKRIDVYKNNAIVAHFCFDATVRSYDYSFTHAVTVYYSFPVSNKAGHNEYKKTYYNRTWETYCFQSCITGCINNIIYEIKEEIVNGIKTANGWKKITEGKRKAVEEVIEQNEVLKILETVKKEVSGNSAGLIEIRL